MVLENIESLSIIMNYVCKELILEIEFSPSFLKFNKNIALITTLCSTEIQVTNTHIPLKQFYHKCWTYYLIL